MECDNVYLYSNSEVSNIHQYREMYGWYARNALPAGFICRRCSWVVAGAVYPFPLLLFARLHWLHCSLHASASAFPQPTAAGKSRTEKLKLSRIVTTGCLAGCFVCRAICHFSRIKPRLYGIDIQSFEWVVIKLYCRIEMYPSASFSSRAILKWFLYTGSDYIFILQIIGYRLKWVSKPMWWTNYTWLLY